MLVLCGKQGIGKSTFFKRISKGWYSDSLTISDMKDKSAAEKIQGIWITEQNEEETTETENEEEQENEIIEDPETNESEETEAENS